MTLSLFSPVQLGALTLPHRVAMAPMTRDRAPRAVPTPLMAEYYRQRADPERGASLIISEGTAITAQGQGYADVPGLYSSEQLEGWRRVTDAVHDAGGRIFCQLWHVGSVSHRALQPQGGAPVAPSAIRAEARTFLVDADGRGEFVATDEPRALERGEIDGIVQDFARAARNAVESAGFDGVELHGANGYLIDQFLKTGANARTDEYGGSIDRRCRFAVEVARAVAEAIGSGRTAIRLSPVTPSNGISDADPQPLYAHLMQCLAPLGLACIHVIEGVTHGTREAPQHFDYAAMKAAYRDHGGRGAWMVNNAYTPQLARHAVEAGDADLVAFGKPFIANPDLTERLRRGIDPQVPDRATFYGGGAAGYTDYPALDD